MLSVRAIPVLLMNEHGFVKTTRFRDGRYLGDPINIVRIFSEKQVDELVIVDIEASRRGRGPDFQRLEEVAGEAFMPICYGGGIRSVDDAQRILRLGMEKVCVNSALFERPQLIRELSTTFGSQCVVASVDVERSVAGRFRVWSHSKHRVTEPDPLRWIDQLVAQGVGEILLNAVHRDGTMRGYDLELLRLLRGRFDVPIIACGGASTVADMKSALRAGQLGAVGVGARFVFQGPHRAVLVSYLSPDELADLDTART